MKKIYVIVSAVLVVVIALSFLLLRESKYGWWKNPNPQEGNIFSGDIIVTKIKNKEGAQNPYLLIVYDKENHALSCTPEAGEDTYTCLPFLKSPNEMDKHSTYQDISVQTFMTPYHVTIKAKNYVIYNVLNIEMSEVSADCEKMGDEGCNLIKLPPYNRWGF